MLHTHLNVPITGRTNGRGLGTIKQQCRFENRGALCSNVLSICCASSKSGIGYLTCTAHDMTLCWYSVGFCPLLEVYLIHDVSGVGVVSRYSDRLPVLRLMALVWTSWMLVCNAYRCHQRTCCCLPLKLSWLRSRPLSLSWYCKKAAFIQYSEFFP